MTDATRSLQLNAQGQLRTSCHSTTCRRTPHRIARHRRLLSRGRCPGGEKVPLLRGKTVCNVFFENFDTAPAPPSNWRPSGCRRTSSPSTSPPPPPARRDAVRHPAQSGSHGCRHVRVRHADSGAAHFHRRTRLSRVAIINGGDGRHAHTHPGMLDMLTIRRHKAISPTCRWP